MTRTGGVENSTCQPSLTARFNAGIPRCASAVAIPPGHAGLVIPRSGLAAEHGITIVNTPGLVDSGYRGELRVILHNTDGQATFVVEPGMRVAQLVVVEVPESSLREVDTLPESERGTGGFGSSGKR